MDGGMEIPRRVWYLHMINAKDKHSYNVKIHDRTKCLLFAYCWCLLQVSNSFMSGVGLCMHSWGSFVTCGHTRAEKTSSW